MHAQLSQARGQCQRQGQLHHRHEHVRLVQSNVQIVCSLLLLFATVPCGQRTCVHAARLSFSRGRYPNFQWVPYRRYCLQIACSGKVFGDTRQREPVPDLRQAAIQSEWLQAAPPHCRPLQNGSHVPVSMWCTGHLCCENNKEMAHGVAALLVQADGMRSPGRAMQGTCNL